MKINIDEIKNNVVPKLNNSINYLEQAINSIAACSIPEYFNYEEYMYKLPNNIRYIKNDVNVVKSWAEDIFIKFENAERNNNSIVSKLNINSIGKVNSKVSANSNNRKVMDEPEVQEGLKNLNNLLNIQNKELSDNAEKMKNSIRSKTYNPYLESLLKEYCNTKDFENLSEVYYMSYTLKSITEQLDLYLVDGNIPEAEIITETNGKKKVQFAGLVFTYEDWKMIKHYLKSRGLTWYDLKEEFREAYGILQTYYGELLERKNSIYSLERYIDLYPYTYITKKDGFKEYLERDFTNVNPESEFNLLTQEEKAIYYYLKEKYSEEDARKYYESLKDIINQRKGELQALEYISTLDLTGLESVDGVSNFLMTTGVGFKDGVWQFGENIVNLIPGQGEIRSELQYKQMYIMQMLTQEINIDEIAKKYGKDSEVYKQYEKLKKMQEVYKQALGVNYNVASAIGNQAIPIAVSFIPVAGKYIGTGLIALSAAGGAKAQAYQNGVTGWDAYLYAGIQGITSAVVTKYFAAIPGLSANASTTITGILKGATQAGLSAVAQSKIDEFTLKVLSKQPGEAVTLDELLKQDAKTFITAFSTAFILNGGKALLVKIKGQQVKITPEDLEKCIDKDGNVDVKKIMSKTKIANDSKKSNVEIKTKATIKEKAINKADYLKTRFVGSINKYFKEKITNNEMLKQKVMEEGILHFTSDEAADKIVSSGYIKRSKVINGKVYGIKDVTYFFAGKPSVEQIALNLDDVPNKIVAIRTRPTDEVVNNLFYRHKDDNALVWRGDFKFEKMNLLTEKAYFILENIDGKLQYKEVTESVYNQFNDNVINNDVSSKKYAKEIAHQYQKELIRKDTNAKTVENYSSISNSLFNEIDPEHGFQLNMDDLGPWYKRQYENGFFTGEKIKELLSINSKGFIDEETGYFLKSLFDNESDIYIKTINTNDAESIISEGVRCLGTTTSGVGIVPKRISDINLENTVTDVTSGGMLELVTLLKGANGISQGRKSY